jgi:murein DD-endopeptidase MepM/ murein hydrolase activator NlpD
MGAALWVVVLAVPAAAAEAPAGGFSVPLTCWKNRSCIVQFYPDQRRGVEAGDYRCGGASYDGHSGTDFRLRHITEMNVGVPVLAAAPGQILSAVDTYPDLPVSEASAAGDPAAANGNSVVIDHGEGWQSRYNHLRASGLKVEVGERVGRGAILGHVGRSGRANFPHLHFEIIYKGAIMDPFSGSPPQSGCGGEDRPLWTDEAGRALAYRDGGLLDAGFSSLELSAQEVRAGPPRLRRATWQTETLNFWASAFLLNQGDREEIKLIDPEGKAIGRSSATLDGDQDEWVRTLAVDRPQGGWRPGMYLGIYQVTRGSADTETMVIDATRALVVR